MGIFFEKLPVIIHQVAFLTAQLIILIVCGVGYSGSLAYIGAISSILAMLVCLRWDVEIMVSRVQELHELFLDASVTIFFMALTIFLINTTLGSPLPSHIFVAAIAIAIHELFMAILFIHNSFYIYAFFRSVPAAALIILALIGYKPEVIWPASFLLSASFSTIYFIDLVKSSISRISIARIKSIIVLPKVYATITAIAFTSASALFVIIISFQYGDEYAGLWSNSIRIFNSIIVFLLATFLPFILKNIGDTHLEAEKVMIFFRLWINLLPLIILSFLIVVNYGTYILSLFTTFYVDVNNTHLSYIFLISLSISFIGSSQGLYQAINKSITLLLMVISAQILAFIIIYRSTYIFSILIEIFLFSSLSLVAFIIIHLKYCSKVKSDD